MKRILIAVGCAASLFAVCAVASSAQAATNWNVTGKWLLTFSSPSVPNIPQHDMVVNGDTATGGQPAGGPYENPWTATVKVSGNSVKIVGAYATSSPYYPYTFTATGTVSLGAMSGTWSDSAHNSGTWTGQSVCTPVSGATRVDWGSVPVTNAGIVATSGETIKGIVAETGCDAGVYVGSGVSNVTVSATVNGAHYVGIYVDGGNTDVDGSTVSNVGDTPFDGVQYGWGVGFVTNGTTNAPATGSITGSKVSAYQKAGIVALGSGTNVTISNNTVQGLGQVTFIAQNGIEVDNGATAAVENNGVSGNSYTGPSSCPDENYFAPGCAQSGGVLLYDALPSTVVSNNVATQNDVGLWAYDDSAGATTTPYLMSNNTLKNNYGFGIVFDSVNGTSTQNFFQGNLVGLLVTDFSGNAVVTSLNDGLGNNNTVSSEAISAPGPDVSTPNPYYEDLIIEANGHPFHIPMAGAHGPHGPHI